VRTALFMRWGPVVGMSTMKASQALEAGTLARRAREQPLLGAAQLLRFVQSGYSGGARFHA
jgi:hypothetical protein